MSLGHIQYGIQDSEKQSLRFKRSLYVVKDIIAGENFTSENIRIIRPGNGLLPKYYDRVLGKTAKQDIKAGTALTWTLL